MPTMRCFAKGKYRIAWVKACISHVIHESGSQIFFILHQVRKSLRYVPWKERKQVAAALRAIYAAANEEAALSALEAFEATWSEKYAAIAPL